MSDNIVKQNDGHVCFTCLKMSFDPNTCSECGAKIGHFDLNEAILDVPKTGKFVVKFSQFAELEVREALDSAEKNYFQTFEVKGDGEELEIMSNHIAYDKFIEAISKVRRDSVQSIKQMIEFQAQRRS